MFKKLENNLVWQHPGWTADFLEKLGGSCSVLSRMTLLFGQISPILETCCFEASVDLLIKTVGKLTAKKRLIFLIAVGYSDPVHCSSLRVDLNGESLVFESSPPAPLQRREES